MAAAALLSALAVAGFPGAAAADGLPAARPDTVVEAAASLLDRGLSVPAASLLSRALSRGEASGPDAVLLAARAHAAHGDWAAVRRLLIGQDWLGAVGRAGGRRLLARAHLELGDPGEAAAEYARHAADAGGEVGSGAAVGRARALAAAGRPREAAAVLLRAADRDRDLAPWLRLSALRALVEAGPGDSAAGDAGEGDDPASGANGPGRGPDPDALPDPARLAEALRGEPVLPADSIRALAAEWAFARGDAAEGLRLATAAGRAADGLAGSRVAPALLAAGDTAAAASAYRRALGTSRPDAGLAPALLALDSTWRALRDAAASDMRSGRMERGVRYLGAALERAPAEERPALAERLASALRARGDPSAALDLVRPWLERPELDAERRAELWLLAARAHDDLGRHAEAADALASAATGEGRPAALAAYLLADRRHDAGHLDAARSAYAASYRGFPDTHYGERSLVRLGLLDFLHGRHAAAEERFEEYRRRYDDGDWAAGALYWTGRTALARGDTAAAIRRFRRVLDADPLGYYGSLAGRRLGRDPWDELDPEPGDAQPPRREHRELLRRMEALREVGWTARARLEYRHAGRDRRGDSGELLALALALDSAGWTWEGVAVGWRARDRGRDWSLPLLRAVYPLPYRDALLRAARERGLSPALVAGLARRESLFDAEVVSSAGAVGIMQLLPTTALDVAARAGLPGFRPDQLTDPEVNLLLGTRYLADVLERFDGSRTAALISYNAGPHRYRAWRDFPERAHDPELFVERIPFRETREYVRAVTALTWIYSRLHGLPDRDAPAP